MKVLKEDRFRGSILGCAVCDALGTTLEFRKPYTFEPIQDMIGGGPFHLEPGQFTDDTSLMLCLAVSLLSKQSYDPVDQLKHYLRWYEEGHLSSNGRCFDIGGTTHKALESFKSDGKVNGGTGAGNGSLMRLCPVPLLLHETGGVNLDISGDSSTTTHGHKLAIDACRYMGALIAGAIQGEEKEVLLQSLYVPPGVQSDYWDANPLENEIKKIAEGSFKKLKPLTENEVNEYYSLPKGERRKVAERGIVGSGYVVKSLEAALWAFYNSSSFEEGCLLAANLGDDADTVAAIYGQLAGAFYGVDMIPKKWLNKLTFVPLLDTLAVELFKMSEHVFVDKETEYGFAVNESYSPSSRFKNVSNLYDVLESQYTRYYPKQLPGPNGYKHIEDFDKDVEDMLSLGQGLIDEKDDENIKVDLNMLLKDFKDRLTKDRQKVEKRISKPKLYFPSIKPRAKK